MEDKLEQLKCLGLALFISFNSAQDCLFSKIERIMRKYPESSQPVVLVTQIMDDHGSKVEKVIQLKKLIENEADPKKIMNYMEEMAIISNKILDISESLDPYLD